MYLSRLSSALKLEECVVLNGSFYTVHLLSLWTFMFCDVNSHTNDNCCTQSMKKLTKTTVGQYCLTCTVVILTFKINHVYSELAFWCNILSPLNIVPVFKCTSWADIDIFVLHIDVLFVCTYIFIWYNLCCWFSPLALFYKTNMNKLQKVDVNLFFFSCWCFFYIYH